MRKNTASQVICGQLNSATTGAAVTSGTTTVYVLGDGGTQGSGGGTVTHEGNGCWSYAPTQAETNYNHIAFTFTNATAIPQTVQVYTISYDPHDTVRLGLTALPNAAAAANGGLPTVDTNNAVKLQNGTGSNQISLSSGAVTVGTNSDKTGYGLSSAAVQAIWDALTSALTTASSIGKLLVDNINATIGSRATQTSVDTVAGYVDTEVAAIKAKTDNLPASPAATSDIPTATQNADALLNRDMSAVSDTNSRSPLNALRFLRNKWSLATSTLTVTKEDDSTSAWTATVTTDAAAEPIIGSDPA